MAEITANSSDGRVLLALRAGPLAAAELCERLATFSPMGLMRRGLIERLPENCYRLTAAGRAACPLRNPLAATVAPAPAAALTARRAGLPPLRPSQPGPIRATPIKPKPTQADPIQPTPGETVENITINPKKDTLSASRAGVFYALKGIDREHAITRQELGKRAPVSVETGALFNALQRMAQEGLVGAFGSTTARRFYDLQAQVEAEDEDAVAADRVADTGETIETPVPHAAPADVEFALYDDGRLAIFDGDELMTLPPEATRRLGHFLGCLEIYAWPPRLDLEALDPEVTHL